MAQKTKALSPVILDEVWTLMKCATGPKEETSDDEFLKSMPEHFRWECSVTVADGADVDTEGDGDKTPELKKDDSIRKAADMLAEMGDAYCKEKEEEAKLIEDIKQYLMRISEDIDNKLDQQLSVGRPPESLFKSGLLSLAYSTFQSKLQSFLGLNEGVDKIAIVTHLVKGVASGFRDSNLPAMHLVSALAYKFVADKYQNVLEEHGSVTKLMPLTEKMESTD